MPYLLWLLAFALCTPVAQTKPRPVSATLATKKATASVAEPVLVVQRTPCHGTCPTYTAAIFADGRVEYHGERFVGLLGQHTLHLPAATVGQLLAEAKRINFSGLQDQYLGNTYDLPATIMTVHPAGQPAKTVRAQANMPAALENYLTFVLRQLDPLTNGTADK
ncbi:MAG: hypothetical protein EOO59_07330 [Hymenobacter sp.]|nr:MAG: hypothetical protein EOO59_07330 [Hymenobacter sp.]